MTPNEKAIELYNTYVDIISDKEEAKICALIAVNTVLSMASHYVTVNYWNEVKEHIKNR
jgi:hypothetical protein